MISYSINIRLKDESKNYRPLRLGVGHSEIKNSHFLGYHNLEMTNGVIYDLKKVIQGKLSEYEWGYDSQLMIESNQKHSSMEDYMYEEDLGTIETSVLLDFMIHWRDFQKKFPSKESLKKNLIEAYSMIRSSPKDFRRWKNSDIDYIASIENTNYSVMLDESVGDFELSPEEFYNEIKKCPQW